MTIFRRNALLSPHSEKLLPGGSFAARLQTATNGHFSLDNTNYARGKLPMIIPVVLHQGPANWNFPTQFADFLDVPELSREEVMPNMPRFEHLLIDLSRVDVDQIRGSMMLRLPLLVMKAVRENRLAELLPSLRPLLIELSSGGSTIGLMQAVFRYLMVKGSQERSSRAPEGVGPN